MYRIRFSTVLKLIQFKFNTFKLELLNEVIYSLIETQQLRHVAKYREKLKPQHLLNFLGE